MRFMLALLLVGFGVVCRVAPHPWNFAPIGAIALFGGATFTDRRAAFLVPLAAMFAGDTLLELFTGHGYHSLMPVLYATYALIALLGMSLREHRQSPLHIGGASIIGATIFFVISNAAVWTISTIYPKTAAGLAACYVAGLPYFGRTIASDLLFSAILFGSYGLAARRLVPAVR
jgi:hypothetical protein